MKKFNVTKRQNKTTEINKKTYYLCETDKDLRAGRYNDFQQLTLMKELGVSPIDFISNTQKVIEALSKGDLYAAAIAYNSQVTAVDMMVNHKSAVEYLFALIVTEEEEDLTEFKKEEAERKLERMYKDGLTYGEMEEIVESFLKGCQTHWFRNFQMSLDSLEIA